MRSLLGRFHRPMSRGTVGNMLAMNSLEDGSTLSLDFTTMGNVLDPRLTFTRASTVATYINSNGYVATATTNEPRFDHSPTNIGELKGLLIEEQRVNLLNWSETFATSGGTNNNWDDTNLTRTSTNNTSPRNDATALQITASAGNGTIISSAAIGTSASRTLSVWLRRVTGTGDIQYTLNNGTNWTTQAITSSWVRYSFAATTAAQRVGFRIVTSADAIEIWGAQLEAGSASSYIPTGASQVTRLLDLCTMTGTRFSYWFNSLEGTFLCNFQTTYSGNTPSAAFILAFDSSGTKRIIYLPTGASTAASYDGVNILIATGTATGVLAKVASSYNQSGKSIVLNGGTVATGAVAAGYSSATSLGIGNSGTVNAHFKQIKFYPTAFTAAQLQTLTAP